MISYVSALKRALVLSAFIAAGSALAGETPPTLDGATVVDADKVKDLHAKGTPIFDVRVANEYVDGHIKGAVSVPYAEKSKKEPAFDASLDKFDVAKLGADKAQPLIIYCNGPECWKSYKASHAAVKAGFKTVYWFRTGYPAWEEKKYPSEK